MKRFLFACLVPVFFWGCKKSDTTLSPVEIQVSLDDNTSGLNILAVDVTQNNAPILNIVNTGSLIYGTEMVTPGDQINITYSAAQEPKDPNYNGAIITYFYKGQKVGITSGNLNYPSILHTTINIPAQ